ncbi:MAG: HDIG domain-containing protein [Pseudomonadales bacterium]|jgi:putative nucleotidyltransferase with HDIG domain|nr:HDIG domain-containing protein [Pseudomonadales bacterium]
MSSLSVSIPTPVLYIIHHLKKHGYEGYLVGGSVRDLLGNSLGVYEEKKTVTVADFDFTTNALPEQILEIFKDSFYENAFGTVSVTPENLNEQMIEDGWAIEENNQSTTNNIKKTIDLENVSKLHDSLDLPARESIDTVPHNFEITTFRSNEVYEHDARHPSNFNWGEKLEDDLSRRDFTINGLTINVKNEKLAEVFSSTTTNLPAEVNLTMNDYDLIDQFNGLDDLRNNIIRTIGDPDSRFNEDALRLLRAIRFSVQLNFEIEENTYYAIIRNKDLIKKISWERITIEFLRILTSDYPKEGILLLDETGLLEYILPELIDGKGMEQCGHHLTDVWQHSLDAVANCPNKDPIVRLATLLHDVGKPATRQGNPGAYTFYNHEVEGAHLSKKIARRLKLSSESLNRLFILVRYHMFYYQPENTDASIRRFMRKVGLENLNDILDLREADRLGSNAWRTSWRLEEMKQRMIEQLHQPMEVRDLAVNGHDLMTELNLQPGPILGEIGTYLLELVLDDSNLNDKETLLKLAKTYLDNHAPV